MTADPVASREYMYHGCILPDHYYTLRLAADDIT